MPTITISGTVIDFPDTAESPDWSSAVIEFALAVESALSGLAGPFDVSPQIMNIDSYNPGTTVDIPNLAFPTTDVRGAFIRYSVYRNTSTDTQTESGQIIITYNPANSIGSKWEIIRSFTGDASILFNITDTGQIQFSTTALGGLNHTGRISYAANALLQS